MIDVAVDFGNTRVKWGRCGPGGVTETVSLPPADADAWSAQWHKWGLAPDSVWVLSGVVPARQELLAQWLTGQGAQLRLLHSPLQLPLTTSLEHPEWAGIDRLLDAVAANTRRRPGTPAVIVDAGSAVTIDYVDAEGTYRGGAILPGLRLMAQALHDYTALLPLITVEEPPPHLGVTTTDAMKSGLFWTLVGGIEKYVALYSADATPAVFLTGGDCRLLAWRLPADFILWPEMTLTGTWLSARHHFGDGL